MVSPRAQRTLRSSNPAGLPGLPALVGDENLPVVWPVDGDDCRLTLLSMHRRGRSLESRGYGPVQLSGARFTLDPVSAARRPRPSLCETLSAEATRPRRELSRSRGRWNGYPRRHRRNGRSPSP